MAKSFGQYRKGIYASINGTKGNMIRLAKSTLLTDEETDAAIKVVNALENFRQIFKKGFLKGNVKSQKTP